MRLLYLFLLISAISVVGSTGQQGAAYGHVGEGNVVLGVDNPPVMGNPTMFHYQTYPQENYYPVVHPKKRCVMTEKGKMKCKYRRDGHAGDSYGVPMMTTSGGGWGSGGGDDGGGGGDASGIAGLLGLVGLKGLKGVAGAKGLITLLPFLPLLGPILFPIVAIPSFLIGLKLILLGVAFLLKPIIVPGRSAPIMDLNFLRNATFSSVSRMVMDVLQSDECVERIVCRVARSAREYDGIRGVGWFWVERLVNSLPEEGRYFQKIKKGLKSKKEKDVTKNHEKSSSSSETKTGTDVCMKFECTPESVFRRNQIH